MTPLHSNTTPLAAPRRRTAAALAVTLAVTVTSATLGCQDTTIVTMYVCTPACAAGFLCGASGCEPVDGSGPDLAIAADLSGSGDTCGGLTCPAATPWCLGNTCVVCLKDVDCPARQICRTVGRTTACVPGCNDDSRCADPKADGGAGAGKCCDGRCTDVASDSRNCGACGQVCLKDHVVGSCAAGACVPGACEPHWADCNGQPADGCEANLRADSAHCMACGAACTVPHGRGGCADGCYLAGCDFGWDDCDGDSANGCERATVADPNNCGACGVVCPARAHASVGCVLANCQLTKCDVGWSDCDRNPDNGCETAIGSDVGNCGACGNQCGGNLICRNGGCTCQACNIANARTTCINNVCAFDACMPGFGDCNGDLKDGCEADLRLDPANCGGCGRACPNGNYCTDSACTAVFSFQASQKIDGQTVTCSAVVTTKAYTECDDFKSNGGYLANGVNCAKAWNGQNSPFSDHEGLCQSLTGSRKFEAFYLCDGGGTRATWSQHKWGTFVDNSFAQHLRCYY